MMSGVNYTIYGCSSARTTPGVSLTMQEVKNIEGKKLEEKYWQLFLKIGW